MTTIPIDRNALAMIFDAARNAAKSPGALAFIDDHASRLDMFLGALERQAKAVQQPQPPAEAGQPPAALPAPKERFDPTTPQAQANRDKRRAKRLAEQAAKEAAQGQEESKDPAE